MANRGWGLILDICIKCGEKATYYYKQNGFLINKQEVFYCKNCLLKRLDDEIGDRI